MKEFINNREMLDGCDPDDARAFFEQEERDWQLVQQAADNGDEAAFYLLRTCRLIGDSIGRLWKQYELTRSAQGDAKELEAITGNIGQLTLLRVKMLYQDYGIAGKRERIRQQSRRGPAASQPVFTYSPN